MKIRTDDIYRTNMTKYEWVNQMINGKILDITCGKYLSYSSSKLLLENNVTEIWNMDILEKEQNITLRKIENKKILFFKKNMEELNNEKFDVILGFDALSITDDISKTIKFIFEHLEDNGQAILSVSNDDKLLNNEYDLDTKDLNLFTKNMLEKQIKPYANNLEFFLQGTIGIDYKEKFMNNTSRLKKILSKSEKTYNIYFKYLRNTKKKISNIKEKRKNKKTLRYEIIPFNEQLNPLFTIVKCKKL